MGNPGFLSKHVEFVELDFGIINRSVNGLPENQFPGTKKHPMFASILLMTQIKFKVA